MSLTMRPGSSPTFVARHPSSGAVAGGGSVMLWKKEGAGDVVEKVLRRAEVAKMARLLQNRLALASFKTRHGWENLRLDSLEPKLEHELKRKRATMSDDTLSDDDDDDDDPVDDHSPTRLYPLGPIPLSSSSTMQSGSLTRVVRGTHRHPHSSPTRPRRRMAQLPAPELPVSGHGHGHGHKRVRSTSAVAPPKPPSSRPGWSGGRHFSQSSPVYHRRHAQYPVSHGANLSFVSTASTLPVQPSSPLPAPESDADDDLDRPVHSFRPSSPPMPSSPPCTPPPKRIGAGRGRHDHGHGHGHGGGGGGGGGGSATRDAPTGEEGADLLMFLASSPSPAHPPMRPRVVPPATPPSRNPALPSSMMTTTPNGPNFMTGFGLPAPATPAQPFPFADFLNVTPSPAQGPWMPRTPTTVRTPPNIVSTPPAAQEVRRDLHRDSMLPVAVSPSLSSPRGDGGRHAHAHAHGLGRNTGLGMELGGELVS
ncbi:MAG: hypothetical protein M1826_001433 [Phylliscum demangeonii]|nr:MAG: hypothetical protein M1826_001433 [Phylliscum demangeonii]